MSGLAWQGLEAPEIPINPDNFPGWVIADPKSSAGRGDVASSFWHQPDYCHRWLIRRSGSRRHVQNVESTGNYGAFVANSSSSCVSTDASTMSSASKLSLSLLPRKLSGRDRENEARVPLLCLLSSTFESALLSLLNARRESSNPSPPTCLSSPRPRRSPLHRWKP